MSSTEIEDVLSSIRRLVSEDMRPPLRPRSSGPVQGNLAPAEAGKLILTPALRVVQNTPNPANTPQDPAGQAVAEPAPLPIFVATRRVQIIAEVEAPFVHAEPAPIEQVVASLGAAVNASPQDWEPEQGDAEVQTSLADQPWALPQTAAFDEPQAWQHPDPDLQPEPPAEPDQASTDIPAWAQEDDEAEMLEPQAEPVHGTVEPDPDWADAAEASVIASLQAEADNQQAQQFDASESEPDLQINEDVLRELVRDILREELAGPMGERITRNIRKLVRAEIATLLATQSLD